MRGHGDNGLRIQMRWQVHGGAGYISEYCVERFYRDVRLFRLYEGTSQIQQLVIAKQIIRNAENAL